MTLPSLAIATSFWALRGVHFRHPLPLLPLHLRRLHLPVHMSLTSTGYGDIGPVRFEEYSFTSISASSSTFTPSPSAGAPCRLRSLVTVASSLCAWRGTFSAFSSMFLLYICAAPIYWSTIPCASIGHGDIFHVRFAEYIFGILIFVSPSTSTFF